MFGSSDERQVLVDVRGVAYKDRCIMNKV